MPICKLSKLSYIHNILILYPYYLIMSTTNLIIIDNNINYIDIQFNEGLVPSREK